MRIERTLRATITAAVFLFSAPAFAQQASLADRETARSLMDDGDKKRDGGDLKGALKNYEAADAIMHVPTTGLEVARTQAALGLLLEARETLARVMRTPAKAGEAAAFVAARKSADVFNGEIGGRIPSLQITLQNAEPGQSPQVTIDAEPIPAAAVGVPRKVNPGTHTVIVRNGAFEKKQDVVVAERETKSISVDLKEKIEPPKPAGEPAHANGSALPKVLLFGGLGLAVVGGGVGAVTGLMSLSKTNSLKDRCPDNACPAGTQSEIDQAKTLGNVSTVAFIVGGVGAGIGIVGLVLTLGQKKQDPPQAAQGFSVHGDLGPAYAGLSGRF